jgi:hypothetical protein
MDLGGASPSVALPKVGTVPHWVLGRVRLAAVHADLDQLAVERAAGGDEPAEREGIDLSLLRRTRLEPERSARSAIDILVVEEDDNSIRHGAPGASKNNPRQSRLAWTAGRSTRRRMAAPSRGGQQRGVNAWPGRLSAEQTVYLDQFSGRKLAHSDTASYGKLGQLTEVGGGPVRVRVDAFVRSGADLRARSGVGEGICLLGASLLLLLAATWSRNRMAVRSSVVPASRTGPRARCWLDREVSQAVQPAAGGNAKRSAQRRHGEPGWSRRDHVGDQVAIGEHLQRWMPACDLSCTAGAPLESRRGRCQCGLAAGGADHQASAVVEGDLRAGAKLRGQAGQEPAGGVPRARSGPPTRLSARRARASAGRTRGRPAGRWP